TPSRINRRLCPGNGVTPKPSLQVRRSRPRRPTRDRPGSTRSGRGVTPVLYRRGVQERPPRLTDQAYLEKVEELANAVCDEASEEGWLTYLPGDSNQTPLQRAINELARNLRHVHYEGDGCLDDE